MAGRNGESDKVTTSVYVDRHLKQEVKNMRGVNMSDLFNETLRDFLSNGGASTNGLELRKQRLEAEKKELEAELNRVKTQLEEVDQKLEERKNEQDPVLEEAIELLVQMLTQNNNAPYGELYRGLDNPALTNQAQKANIAPKKLLELAKEEAGVDEGDDTQPIESSVTQGGVVTDD